MYWAMNSSKRCRSAWFGSLRISSIAFAMPLTIFCAIVSSSFTPQDLTAPISLLSETTAFAMYSRISSFFMASSTSLRISSRTA